MNEFELNGIEIENEEKVRTKIKTILVDNNSDMDNQLNLEIKKIEDMENTGKVTGTSFVPEETEKDGFGLIRVVKYRVAITYEYSESV